jgi:acetyltransferase
MGGVALNLLDGSAVRSTVERMGKTFEAKDLRFFVQKYLPGGKEVIVGAKAEKGLGHLVMFGIGGIYVEILRDVVFKIAPVTTVEAREMLSSLKMAPLLKGVRGEAGVDEEALIEIIERLSQLVTELPMIQELDLNPVVAFEDRAFVVDARVGI